MTQITVDANLAAKLRMAGQVIELCDPDGKSVGQFFPPIDLSEWEIVTPTASEEELDRRERANEPRYTTEEVLEYLEKL